MLQCSLGTRRTRPTPTRQHQPLLSGQLRVVRAALHPAFALWTGRRRCGVHHLGIVAPNNGAALRLRDDDPRPEAVDCRAARGMSAPSRRRPHPVLSGHAASLTPY